MIDIKAIDGLKVDSSGTLTFKGSSTVTAGTEQIINLVDRDFSGTPNWAGTGWSLSSGTWVHTAGANATTLANTYLTTTPASGVVFQISMDVVTTVAGSLVIGIGGASAPAIGQITGTKTGYVATLTCTSAGVLTVTPDATWVGSIDNVSVKVVTTTGNKLVSLLSSSGTEKAYIDKDGAGYFGTTSSVCKSTFYSSEPFYDTNIFEILAGTGPYTQFKVLTRGSYGGSVYANKYRVLNEVDSGYYTTVNTNGFTMTSLAPSSMTNAGGSGFHTGVGDYSSSFIFNGRGLSVTQFIFNRALTGSSNNLADFREGNVSRMVIDSAGLIGIGTTSPTSTLHVKSNTTDGSGVIAATIDTSATWSLGKLLSIKNNGTEKVYVDANGDGFFNGVRIGMGAGLVVSNTAIGNAVLPSNTTGTYNSAIGYAALNSNTTGTYNSAIGYAALNSNTTGSNNSAMGVSALNSNTTGGSNSAMGNYALRLNTTGSNNSAMGRYALEYSTGSNNSAMGVWALGLNTTGNSNSAVGYASLYNNTTGSNNSAVGQQAGYFIANGSTYLTAADNSVFIGYDSRANAQSQTNQIVIGYQAIGNGSNSVVLGNDSITTTVLKGNVGIGTTSPAAKLHFGNSNGTSIRFEVDSTPGHYWGTEWYSVTSGLAAIRGILQAATGTMYLAFYTNTSNSGLAEQMRIDGVGNVGIGTTFPTSTLHVKSNTTDGSGVIATAIDTSATWSSGKLLSIKNNGTEKVSVSASGQITGVDPTAAAHLTTKAYVDSKVSTGVVPNQTVAGNVYTSAYAMHKSVTQFTRDRITPVPAFDTVVTSSVSALYGMGGVLLPNGKVFLIPGGTSAQIYDPTTDTVTTTNVGLWPGNSALNGGVLMPNGKVFCFPYHSTTTARIYDPIADTVTSVGTFVSGSYMYRGGALMSNGKVLITPNNGSNIYTYDPVADTVQSIYTLAGAGIYNGAVNLADGRVLLIPGTNSTGAIYSPDTNSFQFGNSMGNGFSGGVLLPDGRVYLIPVATSTARIYDPATNTSVAANGTFPTSAFGFYGGVLLPDGRVLMPPYANSSAYIYDPMADTLSSVAGWGGGLYINGILMPDGRVFCPLYYQGTTSRIFSGAFSHPSYNFPSGLLLGNTMNKAW